MLRLHTIINEIINEEEEAPTEQVSPQSTPSDEKDDSIENPENSVEEEKTPVEGTTEEPEVTPQDEDTDENVIDPLSIEDDVNQDEEFSSIDKTIEEMIGITEINHTTSTSIIDYEDGGQTMFVQPMISMKSETINKIMDLIKSDVRDSYKQIRDEITGKTLNNTKYWMSLNTLIDTMVRSQLTKSDNMYGLIDEIKQSFKILEIK